MAHEADRRLQGASSGQQSRGSTRRLCQWRGGTGEASQKKTQEAASKAPAAARWRRTEGSGGEGPSLMGVLFDPIDSLGGQRANGLLKLDCVEGDRRLGLC